MTETPPMTRREAIDTIIGMDMSICLDRCSGGCSCPSESIEALTALGVTKDEIENRGDR